MSTHAIARETREKECVRKSEKKRGSEKEQSKRQKSRSIKIFCIHKTLDDDGGNGNGCRDHRCRANDELGPTITIFVMQGKKAKFLWYNRFVAELN